MQIPFRRSLFARLLVNVGALVVATLLLTSAAAVYLLPPQPDRSVLFVFLLLTIPILAAVLVVVLLFARYITAPLSALAQATQQVARGELEAPLTLVRSDEFGALAEDFRTMQAQLAAARRALEKEKGEYARLNELKEQMLANMPHELKTPLAAMGASVQILQESQGRLSEEDQARLLESLKRSIVRLQHLVENMLDASSIQAGRFRLDPRPTPLGPILDEARLFVQPLLAQRRQALEMSDGTGGALIMADPPRVVQTFVNLLSNANKYGCAGGLIRVTARAEGENVRVKMWNDGDPVPLEVQETLFARFARGEMTEQVSGSGLGLAIARAIVEMHHGQIGLTSGDGAGTTVWFTLPLVAGAADEDPDY